MKVLFVGDIIGETGRNAAAKFLPGLRQREEIDLCIANGENAAAGFGITPKVAEQLFSLGIDVITSGNHVWDKKEAEVYISQEPRLLRPANYPPRVPGQGSYLFRAEKSTVAVINLAGRIFLNPLDCPFQTADRLLPALLEVTPLIIIDFHAEATSEKTALAWYLDGRVSAVIGTHTHVQTADERLLPKGTAFITDVGMVGAKDSIIGMQPESAVEKFLTQMPKKLQVATGPPRFDAVLLDLDEVSGKALEIQRISI